MSPCGIGMVSRMACPGTGTVSRDWAAGRAAGAACGVSAGRAAAGGVGDRAGPGIGVSATGGVSAIDCGTGVPGRPGLRYCSTASARCRGVGYRSSGRFSNIRLRTWWTSAGRPGRSSSIG
jgi:hypothetical protein